MASIIAVEVRATVKTEFTWAFGPAFVLACVLRAFGFPLSWTSWLVMRTVKVHVTPA